MPEFRNFFSLLTRFPLGKSFFVATSSLLLCALATAQCTLNTLSPSVTVCTPKNGATVTVPFQVVAGTTDNAHSVTAMKLYIDNQSVFGVNAKQLSYTVQSLGAGSHNITVNAWDAAGAVFKSTSIITVSGTGTAPVSVAVNPTSATLAPGATQQFAATVLNTTNTAVTWSVDGFINGNTTVGTITSNGLYTAPATTGTHNVVATSVADNTKSDTAIVTVTTTGGGGGGTCTPASGPPSVTICAPAANSTVSSPVTISAVGSSSTAITKTLVYIDNLLQYQTTSKSVNTQLNVAPGTHFLVVQFYNGTWVKQGEHFTVSSGQTVGVTISPTNATVAPGSTQQFSANVTGTPNTAVNWDVDGTPGGNSTIGTVDHTGLYTAPSATGSHTVTATSQADSSKSASATVTVSSGQTVVVSISPTSATLAPGGTQQFSVTVTGNANTAVNWSVDGTPGGNSSLGTVDNTGLYTAPSATGSHTVTATSQADSSKSASATVSVGQPPPPSSGNYITWKNDNQRTGQQRNETILTPTTVRNLKVRFTATLDGEVFTQPLYMSGLRISGVTRNVVFVATEHDTVYALDANSGLQVWRKSLLMNGGTTVPQANVGSPIGPVIGITGTPVIDPNSNTLYVVAETLESGKYIHRLHALDVTTGAEKLGGPVVISAPGSPAFASKEQLQRCALLLANGNVYIAFGSQGDHAPYNGWLISYSATTLSRQAAWNVTPGGTAGGIWESGSGPSADSNGNIYVSTGNGSFNGSTQLSMSVVQLTPSLNVVDWFAPWNAVKQSAGDKDLGSGGVLVVPDQSGSVPHELIECGKLPQVYVLNRDNMGHQGATSDSQIVQELSNIVGGTTGTQAGDHCFMTPAYWEGNLYFVGNNDVMKAFKLDSSTGKMSASPTSRTSTSFAFPGAQPVVSSNGSSNGVVWVVSRANVLHAYDANNLANHLYAGPTMPFTKWAVPTVINGMVYVGTAGKLYAYGL